MTEDFDDAGEGEQMFRGFPLTGGSYFTFTMPGGFQVPSLAGTMEGASSLASRGA
jgi:hypothetical protein